MVAEIIDGWLHSQVIMENLKDQLSSLVDTPSLAFIKVGHNAASDIYVKKKQEAATYLGINSQVIELASTISQDELISCIQRLNRDSNIHGILLQMPLPDSIHSSQALSSIAIEKDVDGLHPQNLGRLACRDLTGLIPCTPQGCLYLLKLYYPQLAGLKATVLGRSQIVGIPMALLLTAFDCTTTIVHSKTRDIPNECLQADILVVAIGQARFVKSEWIKPQAIVLDVGINRLMSENHSSVITGDVDFTKAIYRAKAISPVPKGVGPMTVACLMANTVKAFCQQTNQPFKNLI